PKLCFNFLPINSSVRIILDFLQYASLNCRKYRFTILIWLLPTHFCTNGSNSFSLSLSKVIDDRLNVMGNGIDEKSEIKNFQILICDLNNLTVATPRWVV